MLGFHDWTFGRNDGGAVAGWRCDKCGATRPPGRKADLPAAGCTAVAVDDGPGRFHFEDGPHVVG